MKIVSFLKEDKPTFGVVREDRVADIGPSLPQRTLLEVLEQDAVPDLERGSEKVGFDLKSADIEFLPVVTQPRKIFCIGVNYHAHRVETGRRKSDYPVVFTRFANSLVGHQQPLIRPNESERFDYEGELAVIIGKRARRLTTRNALDCVAGYSCFNDGSIRDWQRHTHQFTPGKNFPNTGGLGPWLITKDEVPDPTALKITTFIGEERMQEASLDQLIFSIPELLVYLSTFTELMPGDVIATGTPGGVGDKRDPPRYLKPGDLLRIVIDGVGELIHPVVSET